MEKKLMCDVNGYRKAVGNAMDIGIDAFYRFYQESPDFRRGIHVFETQFLPFIKRYVKDPVTSLDIGYGSGSMVFAASKYFDMPLGLDVIFQDEEVSKELIRNGCDTFKLYVGDGKTIPIDDDVIDFIHSWTVFMHLGKAKIVKGYLAECYRVLTEDGIAVIYWARMNRSKPNETKEDWERSIKAEKGMYREKIKEVNQINLTISMKWMEWEAKKVGFKILERTGSAVVTDGVQYYHGQHGLVLRKV